VIAESKNIEELLEITLSFLSMDSGSDEIDQLIRENQFISKCNCNCWR
jgi:hypothetical protein